MQVEHGTLLGEAKQWHKTTIAFEGPTLSETASTFTDYRLDVTFVHEDGSRIKVPGYFAADGDAANSSATAGSVWQVHFNPPKTGAWSYTADFKFGENVAADRGATGQSIAFDGASGAFEVDVSDKTGDDFRAKGVLGNADGDRYLDFAGTGEAWLKTGVDSPENFLAFEDFDGTVGTKRYEDHANDWTPGDPTWGADLGKGIIGATNYLADEGVNSVYFLAMNVAGDGRDVWPWASAFFDEVAKSKNFSAVENLTNAIEANPEFNVDDLATFDVSKLAQWEVLFEHMQSKGVALHVVLQETENDHLLNGGLLGFVDEAELMSVERAVYYREMVARFGHHNAIMWMHGEENTNTTEHQRAFFEEIAALDPYGHFTSLHTGVNARQDQQYLPHLGDENLGGASIQTARFNQAHRDVSRWIENSEESGHSWVVMADETSDAAVGADMDARSPGHNEARSEALWGSLMAGAGGIEWYSGNFSGAGDLEIEDFRTRENLYEQSQIAREFFENYLPFTEMKAADELFATTGPTEELKPTGIVPGEIEGYVFAKPGEVYVVYTEDGDKGVVLDLTGVEGSFVAYWFDPFEGGLLELGSVENVDGGGLVDFGVAPDGVIDNRLVDGFPVRSDGSVILPDHELLVHDAVLLVKRADLDLGITAEQVLGGRVAEGDTGSDQPPATPGERIVGINIGSDSDYTDADGDFFAADDTGVGRRHSTEQDIQETEDDLLYQTEAYGRRDLNYDFEVGDGTYVVRLHFAEIWKPAFNENVRLFDVSIENQIVADNLDLAAEAGALTALVKDFTVEVHDGKLDIDLHGDRQNPKLSALEIFRVDGPTAPPEPVSELARLFLVDTASDNELFDLSKRVVLDADSIAGLSLSVAAVTDDSETEVESARLFLDGTLTRTESLAPYALFSDTRGDYRGGLTLDDGDQRTVDIEYFSGNRGKGTLLGTDSTRLSVQDLLFEGERDLADSFAFDETKMGQGLIQFFEEHDTLVFFGGSVETSADVVARASLQGSDTVIDFGAGNILTLQDYTTLSAEDILLA